MIDIDIYLAILPLINMPTGKVSAIRWQVYFGAIPDEAPVGQPILYILMRKSQMQRVENVCDGMQSSS